MCQYWSIQTTACMFILCVYTLSTITTTINWYKPYHKALQLPSSRLMQVKPQQSLKQADEMTGLG